MSFCFFQPSILTSELQTRASGAHCNLKENSEPAILIQSISLDIKIQGATSEIQLPNGV